MNEMPLARLERIIAAYGADPARWPEVERESAERLVAHAPAARDLLTRAEELDRALARAAADLPDAAMARLLAVTAFPPPRISAPSLLDRLAYAASAFWPRATVLASMAALGIVVGLTTEPAYPGSETGTVVVGDLIADMDIMEELAL
jgi:hypothetical protein